MKKTAFFSLIILLCAFVASAIPTDAEAKIYDDTVRLHILANSDTREDQTLKLAVRDGILEKYSEVLSKCESTSDAEKTVSNLIPDIEREAKSIITAAGYDYDVHATVGKEWYDTREYEDFTMPCGTYTSLQIVIGNGAGKNWWCVMYPPLCTELASESAPADDAISDYSKEEILLIQGGRYNVKFKILELLSSAFTKNS